MSQRVTCPLAMRDIKQLERALTELGVKFAKRARVADNPYLRDAVDIAVPGSAFGHYRGVGFNQKKEQVELVIDDMDTTVAGGQRVPGPKVAPFVGRVADVYAKNTIVDELTAMGAEVSVTVNEDGTFAVDYALAHLAAVGA